MGEEHGQNMGENNLMHAQKLNKARTSDGLAIRTSAKYRSIFYRIYSFAQELGKLTEQRFLQVGHPEKGFTEPLPTDYRQRVLL